MPTRTRDAYRKSRINQLTSIEQMEQRRLLAVDFVVDGGTLIVKGDEAANTLEVAAIGDAQIGFSGDGVRAVLESEQIKSIRIDLGSGDDKLDISPELFSLIDVGADRKEAFLRIDLGEGNNRVALGEPQKVPEQPNLDRVAELAKNALSVTDRYFGTSEQLRAEQANLLQRLETTRDLAEKEFFAPARELAQQIKDADDPRVKQVQQLLEAAEATIAEVSVEYRAAEDAQAELAAPLVNQLDELRNLVDQLGADEEEDEVDPLPNPRGRAAAPSCSDFENGTVPFSIVFIGGAGNDFISISSSITVNAFLDGNGGNDVIIGGGGHDRIEGGPGNDILVGRNGNDYMLGELGNDSMHGNGNADCMFGGADDDYMTGGGASDKMEGNAGADFIVGNSGNDNLSGNAGNDTLHAGTGNDFASGGTERDFVWGGPDNDVLHGDDGIDVVMGEGGSDRMFGGGATDAMLGGFGSDLMHGGAAFDLMLGEGDDDFMIGGAGPDDMEGGAGNDVMFGSFGNDEISGNEGNDFIAGGNGQDNMSGGIGHDRISGGNALDLMDGDAGNDHALGGQGRDIIYGSAGNDCLAGGSHDDTIDAEAGNDIAHGNGGEDLIFGRAGGDQITGGGESDILLSGLGDDVLISGTGPLELLWGLTGDDTYEGTAGTNIIFDPHAADNNLVYEATGTNLLVFPSTINTTTGFYPTPIQHCSTAIPAVSGTNFNFDAQMFETFFQGADHLSSVGFDGLGGIITGTEYTDSHGLTLENLGAIGVRREGDPASVESLDGYDGSYEPHEDRVLVSHPNHVDPITLVFEPAVQSVGSFVATGTEGVNHTITIEAFDQDDNLITSQTISVNQYVDGDNLEGFWALETADDSIAKVTLLNNNVTDFGNAIILDNITFSRTVAGDFNGDGLLTADDIDELCTAIHDGSTDPIYDVNGDGVVDLNDHDYWVKTLKNTWYGDANLSGEFDSSDLVEVFAAGKYETGLPAGWAEGDWNCDGVFSSGDLVHAFADGGYESGPVPAMASGTSLPLAADDVLANASEFESLQVEQLQEARPDINGQQANLEWMAADQLFEEFDAATLALDVSEIEELVT